MVATTPPIVVAATVRWAAGLRRVDYIYHCQDIHPEIGLYAGLVEQGVLYRFLHNIDFKTVSKAVKVVVLSSDMERTLRARGRLSPDQIVVINNFPAKAEIENRPSSTEIDGIDGFKIIFAGNLGYFQGLECVVEAARLVDNEKLNIFFVGDGAARESLERQAESIQRSRMHFLGYRERSIAESLIAASDIGLITVSENVIRVAYPSKTITYTQLGSPLLLVAETDTEIGRMIEENAIGYVCPPNDAHKLAATIQLAMAENGSLSDMRERSYEVFEQNFARSQQLNRWAELYMEIGVE